jgi:hypothetical protein
VVLEIQVDRTVTALIEGGRSQSNATAVESPIGGIVGGVQYASNIVIRITGDCRCTTWR